MAGLARITKALGGLTAKSGDRTVVWGWDREADRPVVLSDTAAPKGEDGGYTPAADAPIIGETKP